MLVELSRYESVQPVSNVNTQKKDRVQKIRDAIAAAKAAENQTPHLRKFLEAKIPELHRTITLPKENTLDILEKFVIDYIESVPDFIEALSKLTKDAGVYDQAHTFLSIAEDYFISPPELVGQVPGLKGLIDEAYLAHRLIEEISDRMMMIAGAPVSPMDMTLSNVIIHGILSDKFANELDLAVHYAIEALFKTDEFFKNADFTAYLKQQQKEGWTSAIESWPCLAGDAAICLSLNAVWPSPDIH